MLSLVRVLRGTDQRIEPAMAAPQDSDNAHFLVAFVPSIVKSYRNSRNKNKRITVLLIEFNSCPDQMAVSAQLAQARRPLNYGVCRHTLSKKSSRNA